MKTFLRFSNSAFIAVMLIFLFNSKVFSQLSENVIRQIESLNQEKESRTPVQKKMDSQLLYAAKEDRGESITALVKTLEVNVNKTDKGLVPVDIRVSIVTKNLLETIIKLGGEIVFQSPTQTTVTAKLPLQTLEQIAALNEVNFIYPADRAFIHNPYKRFSGNPAKAAKDNTDVKIPFKPIINKQKNDNDFKIKADKVRKQLTGYFKNKQIVLNAGTGSGSVTSEGDATHRAAEARTFFGINGTGVKIGVLSDGVSSLASSQASGDLGSVTVLAGRAGSGDEGTAMLEIIHDLAPGAQLYFATADPTQAAFAQNILDLRTAGCDIIVDDVGYFREAVFQDDNVAQAVNSVTAAGALYFSSAGNEGNKDDNTSGVWEGDFVNSGTGTAGTVVISGGTIHNFSGGTTNNQLTTSNGGAPIGLFWSDPLGGSGNDYDLYILDAGQTTIVNAATNVQDGNDDPVELSTISPAAGRRLVIFKKTAAAVRALHLNTFRGQLNFNTQGQTHGHSAAAAAYCVAATPAAVAFYSGQPAGPFPNPHNSSNVTELFSSDGPRRMFYNANGTPITLGNVLFTTNGGIVRQKPDITAADGTSVTGAGGFPSPFYGTSASAPHAAAIAGLIKSAVPGITPAQIRTALTSSAIDIEGAGVDRNTGAGIVMAYESLVAAGAVPQPVITAGASTITAQSCVPGNGVIDPGETVTVSFCIKNTGGAATTNLVGTLQNNGGVTGASGPQNYGAVPANGSEVCRSFTFTANGTCGSTITASINFQDGATNRGTVTYTFTLGVPNTITVLSQNFDGVTAPALPAGWTTAHTGVEVDWVTSTTNPNSAPNDAFAPDVTNVGNTELVTPTINVPAGINQLTFRNLYNMESTFDGMVLEISINGGTFADITTGGNNFITGGYNSTINSTFSSPIAGRAAWSGLSGGTTAVPTYITSTINLPAATSGQPIKLKWRAATDNTAIAAGAAGVRIDNISINSTTYTCCVTSPPVCSKVHNTTTTLNYCTIQAAIDAPETEDGNTITVDAGTYAENIIVSKSLTILGPNANINACSGSRVAEAIVVPATADISFNEIFHVAASNVTISGFTIDGDNTSITSGYSSTNGADIDAAEGVTNYEDNVNNLTVTDNIFKNLSYFGVTLNGGYDASPPYAAHGIPTSGHVISNNKFQDLGTYDARSGIDFWGGGVLLYNNQYAAISNNCMDNVRLGIQTGNFYQANPGTVASQMISNNTMTNVRRAGIFHNLHYATASGYTLSNNSITGVFNANETKWDGIELFSLSVPSTSTNNIINGTAVSQASRGYNVWNVKNTYPATISGGTVTGVGTGVFVNNYDGYGSDATDGAHASLSNITITPTATGTGVRLYDNPASTHANVQLSIGAGAVLNNGTEGLVIENTSSTVTAFGNVAFTGQSANYIKLINNANNINATTATFGGVTGATATLAQNFTIEDKIVHKIDVSSLGFVLVKASNDYVTPNSFYTPNTTEAKVQRGVDASSNGFTVNVANGSYRDSVVVNKEITITGQSQAGVMVYPNTSNPIGSGGTLGGSNLFTVKANNVTINTLTADGDNPSNGAGADARTGIVTDFNSGDYTNLTVHHTTVKNIYYRGIYSANGTGVSQTFNFHHNTVSNVKGDPSSIGIFNFGNSGTIDNNNVSDLVDAIAANQSTGTVFSNNTVTTSGSGIHTDNNGGSGGTADMIKNNTITNSTAGGLGILVFLPSLTVTVQENTITNVDTALINTGQQEAVTTLFQRNTVDGMNKPGSKGVYQTTGTFDVAGSANVSGNYINNYIKNNDDGFYLEYEAGKTNTITVNNNSITGNTPGVTLATGAGGAGTLVNNFECNWWGSSNAAAVAAAVGAPVDYTPYLTNGTDNAPATPGFQPVPGSCNGLTGDSDGDGVPDADDCAPFDPTNTNQKPKLSTSINSVVVISNNDGVNDPAAFSVGNTPNNIVFDYFIDQNAMTGPLIKAYQVIQTTNVSVPFCNNCSASLTAFTGTTGTASLINGDLPGTLVMKFVEFKDDNNNGQIDGSECKGDTVVYTVTVNPNPRTDFYVDDDNNAGDVYTPGATGNDATGNGSPSAPYRTITKALSMASAGNTIYVDAGSFKEEVNINKSVIIKGSNAGTAGNAVRAAEAVVDGENAAHAGLLVNANNVTIDGFKVTGGGGVNNAGVLASSTQSGLQLINNIITDNVIGVYAQSNGASLVKRNLFDGNNRAGAAGGAAIYTEFSNGLTVDSNEIKNHLINSAVIFAANSASAHQNLVFTKNNIHNNNADNSMVYCVGVNGGDFNKNTITQPGTTAIKFAGACTSISVSNNFLDNNGTGVKTADDGYSFGANSAIQVHENSFTNNTIFAIQNQEATHTINATCNWYGSSDPAVVVTKVSGNVTYIPYLINGTDNDPATPGFQPVPGSCNGGQNCESPTTQAYTSTIQNGNQSHKGELGMRFIVNNAAGIIIKQLGAFDDGGNGITGLQPGGSVQVAIFNRSTHNMVPGLNAFISGSGDAYTGNHRMKNIPPVTLPPGDYVIVAKGYHSGERNGNSLISDGPYPPGNDGGGAVSFGNEATYGPDDPNGFSYPGSEVNAGTSHVYLAGTFSFTKVVPCGGQSTNANLSNLVISQGTLTPAFTPATTSYTASVPNSVTSITVTPTAADATSTITVNGVPVASGSPSGSITLAEGSNIITVVVTAQNGTTTKTYTIDVTRAPGSGGTCESPSTQAYTSTIQNGNQSHKGELGMQFVVNNPAGIIIKQLGAFDDGGNGITGLQPGGSVQVAIFNRSTHNMVPGLNAFISGSGDAYTGNHRMKNIPPVTLPPGDYVIVAKGYHSGERNGNSLVSDGPYPAGNDGGGAISFGNEASYGPDDPNGFSYPSSSVALGTSHVYLAGTFSFTKVVPCGGQSTNANLSNLVISQGTLTPAFTPATTSYTASVPNSVTSITVTPTAADATSTITVNGVPVASGSPSGSITLAEGSNIITVVVTAQNGTTTKTYTIDVTRAPGSGGTCESPSTQAYTSTIQNGNQSHKGELGMQFVVNNPAGIIIKQLGAFDDGGNGITGLQPGGSVQVAIFNRSTHNMVPGLNAFISGSGDAYTGNHRMKNIPPVTLPPGDYVIVAKGYHSGERNGNSLVSDGPYPAGNDGGGAISFGNEASYGPDDPNGFSYPSSSVALGTSHVYLAGTFSFTKVVPCGGSSTTTSVVTTADAAKQDQKVTPALIMDQDAEVYPNPTRGRFTVRLYNLSVPKVTLQILNETGMQVTQKSVDLSGKTLSLSVPFDLSNQPAGLYFIRVLSDKATLIKKVVVER